jgi:hypothetical protein
MRLLGLTLVLVSWSAFSQEKPAAKEAPRILMAHPMGVLPGKKHVITLRGVKLDEVEKVSSSAGTVKLGNKAKVMVPNMHEPSRVGDSSLEVTLELPDNFAEPHVAIVVTSPKGESTSFEILVDTVAPEAEKEPNNSFKQAQPIRVGQTLAGSVAQNQDVDVYRIEALAFQRLEIEVIAARRGSALDSILSLYDETGQLLATSDDTAEGQDSRIRYTPKRQAVLFLVLQDAHDLGGPQYQYRLQIRTEK